MTSDQLDRAWIPYAAARAAWQARQDARSLRGHERAMAALRRSRTHEAAVSHALATGQPIPAAPDYHSQEG
jgi:hypothetical protein